MTPIFFGGNEFIFYNSVNKKDFNDYKVRKKKIGGKKLINKKIKQNSSYSLFIIIIFILIIFEIIYLLILINVNIKLNKYKIKSKNHYL